MKSEGKRKSERETGRQTEDRDFLFFVHSSKKWSHRLINV